MSVRISALYPVVGVASPQRSSADFKKWFGLEPVFQSDWYVHLSSPSGDRQIGFVRFDHESVPEEDQQSVRGAFVTMDADNVKALWEQHKEEFDVVVPLKDEAWGQRHFICRLAGGVLVDVVQMLSADK